LRENAQGVLLFCGLSVGGNFIMLTALWLPLSLVAGFLQIVRNAAQRGLSDEAGPWGATLVRFLFGLPFALAFLGLAWWLTPPVAVHFSLSLFAILAMGATAQVCATAALIASMRASSFALGSTFQHMSLPLAALFGAVFLGDHLGAWAWTGIGVATLGLLVASWPNGGLAGGLLAGPGGFEAGAFGLMSGACFAVSANAYRVCGMGIDPSSPFFSSSLTLVGAQTLQSLVLGAILFVFNRRAVTVLFADWKVSLIAGLAGAAASACWFAALTLAPAALVRAVNALVEAPAATIMGWVRFKERIDLRRGLGASLIVGGVLMGVLLH
jgi:drug/metabolite transporter (DMT)-like permease